MYGQNDTGDELGQLRQMTAKSFAAWLYDGIYCYNFETDVAPAFVGATSRIGVHDTLVQDLEVLYQELPAHVRTKFREGAAQALARVDYSDPRQRMVARELLILAGRIAAFEVIQTFLRAVDFGRGGWFLLN